MGGIPKRTRPNVKIGTTGTANTIIIQPSAGPVLNHRPWGRVTLTPRWFELAREYVSLSFHAALSENPKITPKMIRDMEFKSVSNGLLFILNADHPTDRPPYIAPGSRVELRFPTPDGRIVFVAYEKGTDTVLARGTADTILLSDLIWALVPMVRFRWEEKA